MDDPVGLEDRGRGAAVMMTTGMDLYPLSLDGLYFDGELGYEYAEDESAERAGGFGALPEQVGG
jgi:hypothetical protein